MADFTGGIEMEPKTSSELTVGSQECPLDALYAELIETLWACERAWDVEEHVDAAIKYGRA